MTEYIERSRLLERARKVTEYDEGGWCTTYQAVSVRDIGLIPAADVAPVVHGEWNEGFNLNCELVRDCSLCGGRYIPEYEDDEPYKYCPWCGAKMDGGKK